MGDVLKLVSKGPARRIVPSRQLIGQIMGIFKTFNCAVVLLVGLAEYCYSECSLLKCAQSRNRLQAHEKLKPNQSVYSVPSLKE